MTVIMPPTPGEDVQILAPPRARLRGHVTGRGPEALTIELEPTLIRRPFRFAAGSTVDVEWKHKLGVMQQSARVAEAREEPSPTIELELVGAAEPVERRGQDRRSLELRVSAWALAQPTTRLAGNTVDLSVVGALLWLPELAPHAAFLELSIEAPGGPVHASAEIIWRRDPALVGVQFQRMSPDDQARLIEFLRQPH
jgi:hypothetical protein